MFGSEGESLAKEDAARQEEIYRRLGLTGGSIDEKGSHEKVATDEHKEHA